MPPVSSTSSHDRRRRVAQRRPHRLVALLLALVVLGAACSSDGEVVAETPEGELTRGEVFDQIDPDDDGVALRDDFDQVVNASGVIALIEDRSATVASFPGGELTTADVLDSLVESPPSNYTDFSVAPDRAVFVARLTAMLRLRLSAVALTDLGFPVTLDASDSDINDMVAGLIEGEFEVWAQEQLIAERPEIVKVATPHCLSLIAVATEEEALAARDRVLGGEAIFDVAAEVNFENTTEVGGGLGCDNVLSWQQSLQELAADLENLGIGEMSEPAALPVEASPTGELWLVLHVDEVVDDLADVSILGPFAGTRLTPQMQTYTVDVAEELGIWLAESLSISLPQ